MAQDTSIAADKTDQILKLASDIVAAYVSNNPISASEVPEMIKTVHGTLGTMGKTPRFQCNARLPRTTSSVLKTGKK